MGFYKIYENYKNYDVEEFFDQVDDNDVLRALNKNRLDEKDLLTLLSPQAGKFLEPMARKAQMLTQQHFGKSILLFTPMYLSNYCTNGCVYCTYNAANHILRKRLTMEEISKEAKEIAKTGLQHILILTGGSREITAVSYIVDAVKELKKHFSSISIEIYALTEDEYKQVVDAGVDGFVMYQEVYDEEIYKNVHLSGEKSNYHFRMDAPERACKAGMRTVNIGALLGLNKWRKEAFITGLHADISLIINGNAQVAKDIQADGLQIGFKDFMESKPYFAGLIGVSVHSLEEAVLAEKNRADYVLASHIFPTACKKGLAPKGIPWLREISSNISIPVIALGGINLNNIKSVFESQVQGVALMSGIMCANDISRFVGKLKLKIKE